MSTFLRESHVKIRRRHCCFGCCRLFPIGTKMQVTVSVDQGMAASFYTCETCEKIFEYIRDRVVDENFGITEGWVCDSITDDFKGVKTTPEEYLAYLQNEKETEETK
jgi:hypothetical protein